MLFRACFELLNGQVTTQLKGHNFLMVPILKGNKLLVFNLVMMPAKYSVKSANYEIPSPAEDEESTNTATMKPLC